MKLFICIYFCKYLVKTKKLAGYFINHWRSFQLRFTEILLENLLHAYVRSFQLKFTEIFIKNSTYVHLLAHKVHSCNKHVLNDYRRRKSKCKFKKKPFRNESNVWISSTLLSVLKDRPGRSNNNSRVHVMNE